MKVVKITVGAAHKLAIPGAFETINPSISLTAELSDGEDLSQAVEALKAQVDQQFWRLAYKDYLTALQRHQVGGNFAWFQQMFPQG